MSLFLSANVQRLSFHESTPTQHSLYRSITAQSSMRLNSVGCAILPIISGFLLSTSTKLALGLIPERSTMAPYPQISPRTRHVSTSSPETSRTKDAWNMNSEQAQTSMSNRADRSRNPPLSASSSYRPSAPKMDQNTRSRSRSRSNSLQTSQSNASSTRAEAASSIRRSHSSSAEHRSLPQTIYVCAVSGHYDPCFIDIPEATGA